MTAQRRKKLSELVVHIGAGFAAKERPHVRQALASLRPYLGNGDGQDVSVEISVQDRGRGEQRVTLRTTLPGGRTVVAVVADVDLTRALHEAKRQLARQLEQRPVAPSPAHGGRDGRIIRHRTTRPRALGHLSDVYRPSPRVSES